MKKNTRLFAIAFLFPGVLLFSIFIVGAIIMTAGYSLTEWDAIGSPEFIGLKNYYDIF